ncbi:hypothetical protein Enr8_46280 [Blastopirellula retiformator]|uniref:Uncharacterized protein n=1 Tax=Blastopirellula retiformator TaxID=2527970 RepID=A0A5C5UUB8_9BACT|nr:hypothetical protein Enr8_46280 [Blastopirellula retiformator]
MPAATILRERPTASVREIQFHATENCLWVMFEDEEYTQWCGIFGAGTQRYEGKIIELSEGEFHGDRTINHVASNTSSR